METKDFMQVNLFSVIHQTLLGSIAASPKQVCYRNPQDKFISGLLLYHLRASLITIRT